MELRKTENNSQYKNIDYINKVPCLFDIFGIEEFGRVLESDLAN